MTAFYKKYDNSMEPKYKYRPGVLGAPLSIQSANQIQDMGIRLNEGMKNIIQLQEIPCGFLSPTSGTIYHRSSFLLNHWIIKKESSMPSVMNLQKDLFLYWM